MKTEKEVFDKAWNDWKKYYYRINSYDRTNSGDMTTWGAREYLRRLLGLYSCHWCGEYFDNEDDLCICLKSHGVEIKEGNSSYYSEYANVYYRSSGGSADK